MHDLQLVGFTTDRRGLIFRTRDGTRAETSFVVPVTEELVALVTQLADERATEIDAADEVVAPAAGVDAPDEAVPRPRSLMSVRDIQARLRAGEPLSSVAAEAGVDEDWIERFAPPIRAEQRRIVERALERHLERSRSAPSAVPLRRAVGMALADKGIAYTVAAYEAAWSARLLGHDRWAVEFTYRHRGRNRTATWTYDADADVLTTSDRASAQLGYVAPGSAADGAGEAVDGIIGDPTATASRDAPQPAQRPAPTAAPVTSTKPQGARSRSTAKKATAKKSSAKKSAVKKSAVKKSAVKKSSAKKAAVKKSSAKKAAVKKAAVKKSSAKKAAAKKSTAKKSSVKKAAVKKAAVKKSAAKKSTAKKATAKKATAKKAAGKRPAAEEGPTGRGSAPQEASTTQVAAEAITRPTGAAASAPTAAEQPARVGDDRRPRPDSPRPVAGRPGEVPLADVPLAGRGEGAGTNGPPPQARPAADGRAAPQAGDGGPDLTSARRIRAVARNATTVQFRSGSAAPVRTGAEADGPGSNGRTPADHGGDTARPRPERGEPDGAARPASRRRRQLRAR